MTDWLTGYNYRKSHDINSAAGAGTNYQIPINVYVQAGASSGNNVYLNGNCKSDFSDIRFTKDDGITELSYFQEPTINYVSALTKYASNPVLTRSGSETQTAFNSVVKVDATYHMYYSCMIGGVWYIDHATASAHTGPWTKDAAHNHVLVGTGGKFDAGGVWCPNVWIEGSTWYMLYSGSETTAYDSPAVGYATSTDGLTWTKQNSGNPVLEGTAGQWDETDVEGWAVIKDSSTYYLYYESLRHVPRQLSVAHSTDLINWTKDGSTPVFTAPAGTVGRYCPAIFKYGSLFYLIVEYWPANFTAGTSILEVYSCPNPSFHSDERTYIGNFIGCGANTTWDDYTLDTPFVYTADITRTLQTDDPFVMYYAGASDGSTVDTGIATATNVQTAIAIAKQFWVKIPDDLSAVGKTIYIYYGKADATTTSSGDDTFPFFDDFIGSLNASKWTTSGTVTQTGGVIQAGSGADSIARQNTTNYPLTAAPLALRLNAKVSSTGVGKSTYVGLSNADLSQFALSPVGTVGYYTYNGSTEQSLGADASQTTFHTYDILCASNVIYKQDGITKATHTNPPSVSMGAYIRAFTTTESVQVDWIFARKYVSSEPANSTWGNEEAYSSGNPPIVGTVHSIILTIGGG